jgi:hypothetical protein
MRGLPAFAKSTARQARVAKATARQGRVARAAAGNSVSEEKRPQARVSRSARKGIYGKTLRNLRKRSGRRQKYQSRAQRHAATVRAEPAACSRARQRRHSAFARLHALPALEQGDQGRIKHLPAASVQVPAASKIPASQEAGSRKLKAVHRLARSTSITPSTPRSDLITFCRCFTSLISTVMSMRPIWSDVLASTF